MTKKSFAAEVIKLMNQKPIAGYDYYEITLLGNSDGTVNRSITTQFAGYTETKPRREIREASLVDPEKMLSALSQIGEPALVINDRSGLTIFLLHGGHAIVEKSLAAEFFPELIKPRESAFSQLNGRWMVSGLPKQQLQHAPSKKLRMNVLKRDSYKCRACGRTPANDVDIELHVHHIYPWGQGGVTEEENLITLCQTCHDGLEPHFDFDLFSLIGIDPIKERLRRDKARYVSGVQTYQKIARQLWEQNMADAATS